MLETYLTLPLAYVFYFVVVTTGITLGYHRYFSHGEFKANAFYEIVMLYCGLLCGCRSPLAWAGVHRMHHAYADTPKDPHSARYQPWWRILFSLWHVDTIPRKFVKDLLSNSRIMFFHKYRYQLYVLHLITTYLLFGPISIFYNFFIFVCSYLGFGMLNLFGHDANGPVNKLWINLVAPFEGNHLDHHKASAK